MLTVKDLSKFDSITEVTTMLDCSVLEVGEYGGDTGLKRQFWLGDAGDNTVGLPAFRASPYFDSLSELNDFCFSNIAKYESAADLIDKTDQYPDTWFWEMEPSAKARSGFKP